MFGIYENFPEIYHSVARFSCKAPTNELQKAILSCLCEMNRNEEELDLPEFSRHNIDVELDFGIADGLTFNYLDKETLKHCQQMSSSQVFSILDFLCIVRYYAIENEKRNPLRFDYHMLRFLFGDKEVELQVYHEKGTRRLSIEDLITFLMTRMNQTLAKKKLSGLKTSYVHAL